MTFVCKACGATQIQRIIVCEQCGSPLVFEEDAMLSDADKTEAKRTLATLLEVNEPEELVSAMRLMCERKKDDPWITQRERDRWASAAGALMEVEATLAAANAPPKRADADFAPDSEAKSA